MQVNLASTVETTAASKADAWAVAGTPLHSRFLLGTAGYPSPQALHDAIAAARPAAITVGLRRTVSRGADNGFVAQAHAAAREVGAHLLPNTAGCRTAREAVALAQMARELYEVVGDEHTLQPDPVELVQASAELARDGFIVWPYCTDDLVTCRRLLDAGCAVLMPWGAPIGSGQGLLNPWALRTLRQRLPDAVLIVDAGIGAPSHAAAALEMGFDAVLLNSAVAQARDPVAMAGAFADAVRAGRTAFTAGVMAQQDFAVASTPTGGEAFLIGGAP
jgi:thiazole synthase